MVSRDEAQSRNYAAFRNAFGSDEEMLLSVTHPRLLAPEGLRFLDELTREIGGLGGVRRVYSLTNARHAVNGTVGVENEPLVPRPFNVPGVPQRILSALDDNPKLASLLISRDRRTAGITIEIDDRAGTDTSRTGVIDELRGMMARRTGEAELHLSGIAVQKHDVAEFVQRDKTFLVPLSMMVLATMLTITFRRVSGVLIPMAVKVVSVAWTMGAYCLGRLPAEPDHGASSTADHRLCPSPRAFTCTTDGCRPRRVPATASLASSRKRAGSFSRPCLLRLPRHSDSWRSPSAISPRSASSGFSGPSGCSYPSA